MPFKINLASKEEPVKEMQPEGIKVNIVPNPEPPKEQDSFQLNSRSAVNGDIMIFDHRDIDIVLRQDLGVVLAFAKETISDYTYGAESRLLEFMRRRGVLEYDSIQGGNIYGSLEGKLLESDTVEVNKVALKVIAEWMKTEESYNKGTEAYDEMAEEHLIDPDDEFSTELGEVPAETEKGSITGHGMFGAKTYGRYSYE
tara:strand:- start:237 stop:833 length:597 start_codon:yes stop_codon:yes gene_type:complete